MTWKPCLDCGTPSPESRCLRCAPREDRRRQQVKPTSATRTSAERRRRARTVRAWRRQHGDWCGGWGDQPPHRASDLTADHVVAVAVSGDQAGPLQVLCRACNAAKGSR